MSCPFLVRPGSRAMRRDCAAEVGPDIGRETYPGGRGYLRWAAAGYLSGWTGAASRSTTVHDWVYQGLRRPLLPNVRDVIMESERRAPSDVPWLTGGTDTDVATLVDEARGGSQTAWDQLVERYLPLVTSLMRRYRVTGADADDVNQTVWLRLVEHLDRIDDPRALPGWLSTVTRHECFRIRQTRGRSVPTDPQDHDHLRPTRRRSRPARGAARRRAPHRPRRRAARAARPSAATCCCCSPRTHR